MAIKVFIEYYIDVAIDLDIIYYDKPINDKDNDYICKKKFRLLKNKTKAYDLVYLLDKYFKFSGEKIYICINEIFKDLK